MDAPDGLSEPTRRRLALYAAGWVYQASWWSRARGDAVHELWIDRLPPACFAAVVGHEARHVMS